MSRWQAVYEERPTFDSLLGGKGYSLPEAHRKWLALAKDYRLQDTMGASDEKLHALDLKIHEARRREQDVQAAAMRQNREVGDVALGNFTNGTAPAGMFDDPSMDSHQEKTDAEVDMAISRIRETFRKSRERNLREVREVLDKEFPGPYPFEGTLATTSYPESDPPQTRTFTDAFAEKLGTLTRFTTGTTMAALNIPMAGFTSDMAGWYIERETKNIAELAEILGISLGSARKLYHEHQKRIADFAPPPAALSRSVMGPPMLA